MRHLLREHTLKTSRAWTAGVLGMTIEVYTFAVSVHSKRDKMSVLILLFSAVLKCSIASVDATALFVFGDSLVDVGTNIYLNATIRADFPPYGRDYFHHPTGRFSNGRNTIDFIAQYLGIPFPLPYLDPQHNLSIGVNFASGGSSILNLSTTQSSRALSLSSQLEQFRQVRDIIDKDGVSDRLSKSLFVISSGGNDLLQYMTNSSLRQPHYVHNMSNGIRNAVQELYDGGARKVVVYGLGPVGCVPAVLAYANSCLELGNEIALAFNNAVEQVLSNLMSSNPGLYVVFTKVYDLVTTLTTAHNSYGFTHQETACCGGGNYHAQAPCGLNNTGFGMHVCSNASDYFFWDYVHPTEAADELLVRVAWEGNTSFATPFNISTLVALE